MDSEQLTAGLNGILQLTMQEPILPQEHSAHLLKPAFNFNF